MKKMWKLTKSPFGFMLLDRTPIEHVFKTFLDPFTRFNMEDYLQTVLTSDLTHTVYSVLVKNASEIKKNYNYNILSKYFAVASKLGGVSIIFSSRRHYCPGGGGTPYNGLYGEAPPEWGTFFRFQVYKRVRISQV